MKMNEAEWLACGEPPVMLNHLGHSIGARKERLFACACCWRIRLLFRDDRSHSALRFAEEFADGLMEFEDLRRHQIDRQEAARSAHPPTQAVAWASWEHRGDGVMAAGYAADAAGDTGVPIGQRHSVRAAEEAAQAALLREIVGNPFRPVLFSSEWRTDPVLSLASQMYESGDFSLMPVLADALQEADCEMDDILNHCRGPGLHVRGCWVVDLVLGKG